MPDGLYERDILAWSEEQARLLQRLADGEAGVNAAVDWPNLIEEVQDLGLSSLKACESLLRQALVHLLKLYAWPGSRSAGHWRSETLGFLADAQSRYSPSMRQRLDVDGICRLAVRQVLVTTDDSGDPRALPARCPFGLDDLLGDDPDVHALAARMGAA